MGYVQAVERPQRVPARRPTVLLREIIQLTEQFERYLGGELSVNPTDLEAMAQLIADGPLSPTEIARRLGVTTAAATTVVDRLSALGHVSRQANSEDRRGVLVVPAVASVAKAMDSLVPMIRGVDHALDEFTTEEQQTIESYLETVATVYRGLLPSGPR